MWDHASDGLVEDSGWGSEMEWTASGWVVSGDLSEVGVVLHYVADLSAFVLVSVSRSCSCSRFVDGRVDGRTLGSEEFAGNIEGFASHDDKLLTVEQLLCDSAGQTTEQVTLAVNDNLAFVSPPFHFARSMRSKLNVRLARRSTSCLH